MRASDKFVRVAAVLLAFALGAAACGGGAPEQHAGHGVVQALDAQARKITLDHEDIPGFMKGMTMTFELAPEVALEGIAPGAEVDFRVYEQGGVYTVTEVRRRP